MNGKQLIAVDWDGTCVEQVWPAEGDWLPGSVKALKRLLKKYDVMIYTTRIVGVTYDDWAESVSDDHVKREIAYIRRMLDDAGLQNVGIFESYPGNTPGKLSAIAYIDDRAVPFNGSWISTIAKVNRLLGN